MIKTADESEVHGGTHAKVPTWKPIVMQAKHQTPCSYCHLPISPGNAIYPWGDYTGYMHLGCALKEAEKHNVELLPPVCKHWSRRGYCLYKDNCFYRHPLEALPPKPDPDQTGYVLKKLFGALVLSQDVPDVLLDVRNHNASTNQAQRISNRGVGRRNLVRNAFRAGVFRRFLIDTFGRELLDGGSGVLDIAGGKGELSFELINLNDIHATVVEPRPLQLWRQHKWMLKGYYHRNVNFQSYVDHKHQEFVSGARVCVDPPHLRMVFDKTVVNSLAPPAVAQDSAEPSIPGGASRDGLSMGCDSTLPLDHGDCQAGATITPEAAAANHTKSTQHQEGCLAPEEAESELRGCVSPLNAAWQAVLQHSMRLAQDTKWTHKGLQHEDGEAWADAETGMAEAAQQELQTDLAACDSSGATELDQSIGSTDILHLDLAQSIIQDCSVIVGIHPDQAAEPIIDFAQRTGRPFAMVPCCVYPMEFPRRRLPDGTWVRKYEQLIEYLQSRDPHHIKVTTLPFEGRNQVVYCTSWKD